LTATVGQAAESKGLDHTRLFSAPFGELAATRRAIVLDGEIAVPDERGVTHIDAVNDAMASRRTDGLAYFAFDLLHLGGHDLRRCPIEERKAVLRRVIGDARCERRGRFNCGLSYYCEGARTSGDDQP